MYSIEIDGVDGTGKTTLISKLKSSLTNYDIKDRGLLTKLSCLHHSNMPSDLPGNTIYIILDASPETCADRLKGRGKTLDKFEDPKWIHYFLAVYKMMASKYGIYLINTDKMTPDDVVGATINIIKSYEDNNKSCEYLMPNPDTFTDESFGKLETIAEGESKIIKKINHNWHLIQYKPSVYSHTNQSAGFVDGTDIERMKMTRETMILMWLNEITHCYVYVGNNYILTHALSNTFNITEHQIPDITDIEVIVKNYYSGTDKHRYWHLDRRITRTGKPVCKAHDSKLKYLEYEKPYVRFDLRNPNHNYTLPDRDEFKKNITGFLDIAIDDDIIKKIYNNYNNYNLSVKECHSLLLDFNIEINTAYLGKIFDKKPWGDYNLADTLADNFIDVENAKKLALKVNHVMKKHFGNLDIYFIDFCLMITSDGQKIYGEFSQDCTRCDKVGVSLTKDVWRAGGSNPDKSLLLARYREMSESITNYNIKLIENEMFLLEHM